MRVIGEQTRFLLAELVALYETDGLLSPDDTVVVAARAAWPGYQLLGAYICRPHRWSRASLKYFGFYAEGAIHPLIPQIRKNYTVVLFACDEANAGRASGEAELASLIEYLLNEESRTDGEAYDVLLLTAPMTPRQSVSRHPSPTTRSRSPASRGDGRSVSATPAWTSSPAAQPAQASSERDPGHPESRKSRTADSGKAS